MDTDVRVRLRFVTADEAIRVSDAPLAVPVQLNRRGLSEVVNHLRTAAAGGSASAGDVGGLYDFVIDNQLVRCSLDKFLRATGISTEATVMVEYFRSLTAPEEGPKSSKADAWIGSLTAPSSGSSQLIAGCYDGVVRVFGQGDCASLGSWRAHDGPIKAVAAFPTTESSSTPSLVVTAGKDRVLKTWAIQQGGGGGKAKKAEVTARQREVFVGHENSVEAAAVSKGGELVLSGDWGGMLCLWKPSGEAEDDAPAAVQTPAKKRQRKGSKGDEEAAAVAAPREAQPAAQLKAHAQCVSGLACDPRAEEKAFTASWDHSVKLWHLERRDCLQTLAGSKVVTCLALSPATSGLIAAGHPDGRVRTWDLRTAGGNGGPEMDVEGEMAPVKRALAGCGAWIADVAWHPARGESVLGSVSHDGQLRLWDLRGATKPLFTVPATDGEAKALAFCFAGEGDAAAAFTGGADGVVRRFAC